MESKEMKELIISWITISFAFGFVLANFSDLFGSLAIVLPMSFIGVGTGFIFHELAHRQTAKYFGAHAEYRLWTTGLLIAIALPIISLGKFMFAAPGAVYIYGPHITRQQNGLISLAGPATNIVIAIIAFLCIPFIHGIYATMILNGVMQINIFLALFNLIPFGPLDGSKVINWNVGVWAIFFIPLIFIWMFF